MQTQTFFDSYRPAREWYQNDSGGIHGYGHAARVLVWADYIAARLEEQGQKVDREVVRVAAALHDVRRYSDGSDLAHGERCATWLKYDRPELPFNLTPEQLTKVIYCVRWHVPEDDDAPEMTLELMCLKDADGLDRVRLADLDTDFLRTDIARKLPNRAQKLFEASETSAHYFDQWSAAKDAAQGLGLWR